MRIQNALISVFHKDGLGPIVDALKEMGTTIYSTGGTQAFIEDRGIAVERVEDLTSYPSILGGRVKTLHPKVFGGILARRIHDSDRAQMSEFDIPYFDLVIVVGGIDIEQSVQPCVTGKIRTKKPHFSVT